MVLPVLELSLAGPVLEDTLLGGLQSSVGRLLAGLHRALVLGSLLLHCLHFRVEISFALLEHLLGLGLVLVRLSDAFLKMVVHAIQHRVHHWQLGLVHRGHATEELLGLSIDLWHASLLRSSVGCDLHWRRRGSSVGGVGSIAPSGYGHGLQQAGGDADLVGEPGPLSLEPSLRRGCGEGIRAPQERRGGGGHQHQCGTHGGFR
mmetsp:Transcript_31786/g.69543  ORF Transcript_31786/g.69543 Transcript_31786/m.69543 type:complete len:204 (+) Transcript_31786:338-949(+)